MMSIDLSMLFSLKCLLTKYHFYIVFTSVMMVSYACAILIDVFEGDLNDNGKGINYDLYDYLWSVFVIISTVGYGDITPRTNLGRLGMTITALLGIIIVSIMIMALQQKIQLSAHEIKAFNFVTRVKDKDMLGRYSEDYISTSLLYIINKKRYLKEFKKKSKLGNETHNLIPYIKNLKESLSKKLKAKSILKSNISKYYNTYEPYSRSEDIKKRFKYLNSKLTNMRTKHDKTEVYVNKLYDLIELMEKTDYPQTYLQSNSKIKKLELDIIQPKPMKDDNNSEILEDKSSKMTNIPFVSNRTNL